MPIIIGRHRIKLLLEKADVYAFISGLRGAEASRASISRREDDILLHISRDTSLLRRTNLLRHSLCHAGRRWMIDLYAFLWRRAWADVKTFFTIECLQFETATSALHVASTSLNILFANT